MPVLTKIRIFPTGMRLHEWIAFAEGFFSEQGLEPEVMWDVYHGQMKAWTGGYKARPQDKPFLEGAQAIGNACAWGSVCNAGAGMGKFVPDAYGVARHAIYVRPDSRIHRPEDLRGVPVAVGLMAGSHYNVPYRLEKHLPLEDIKIAPVGGFGRRLEALLNGEVEAASLLDPQIYMAEGSWACERFSTGSSTRSGGSTRRAIGTSCAGTSRRWRAPTRRSSAIWRATCRCGRSVCRRSSPIGRGGRRPGAQGSGSSSRRIRPRSSKRSWPRSIAGAWVARCTSRNSTGSRCRSREHGAHVRGEREN